MSYDSVVIADSPIAYWKLEELTPPGAPPNLDCIDSGGGGHNGSLNPASSAGFIQGITGPILTDASSFGCVGPIARIPATGVTAGTIFLANAQSWECWTKKSGTSAVQTMVNRGESDITDTYLAWGQRSTGLFSSNALFSLDWGGADTFGLLSCALDDDTWYHVVGTRDGSTMNLYVDGWLVDTRSDVPSSALTLNQAWRLGYMVNTVFGAINWSAGLSHVAIYDYALTQVQIRTHTVAALGSLPSNPCGDTPTVEVGCPDAVGTIGEPYSSSVTVIGGTAPYTYAIISGALPDGLTLDPSTGAITGTPTVGGTFSFTVQVTDSLLNVGTSPGCQIVIDESPPPPPNPPMTRTFQVDAGTGSQWYLVPQLADSGEELRSKTIKAVHVTGKLTNAEVMGYAYDVGQPIKVADLESGTRTNTRNVTRPQALPDTNYVEQSERKPININGTLHTVRLSGDDTGEPTRDRVEEIVIEQAIQGVRR